MSPDLTEEPPLSSHKFEDADDCVLVTLYAKGAIEIKAIDIISDPDDLEICIPSILITDEIAEHGCTWFALFLLDGQRWKFQLYAHIYSDQIEVTAQTDASNTRTAIELRLHKQQIHTSWPRLCSRVSVQQEDDQNLVPMTDDDVNALIQQESPEEISVKNIPHTFTETSDNRVIVRLQIKQVFNCQAQFTDTNFTVTFQTRCADSDQRKSSFVFWHAVRCFSEEEFLRTHAVTSTKPIKVFVRVNDRIKAQQCSRAVTEGCIEITLVKDSEHGMAWKQLEPNAYSLTRPSIHLIPTSMHPLGLTKTNPIKNNLTKRKLKKMDY